MGPDLPYVREDVPGTLRGRMARGLHAGMRWTVVVGVASAVSLALLVPLAKADDLTDQRDRVKAQQAAKKQELNESSHALNAAVDAVSAAQTQLASAQAALAQTQAELATAERVDAAMAAKLKSAQAALVKAKAAVAANQKKLDAEKKLAGQMVRDQYQQQTNLLPIAMLVQDHSTADLQTRLQWSTTMFDTTAATIDRTEDLQAKLDAAKKKQAAIEKQVAADRKAAADSLATKQRLEQQAAQQQASVASLLSQRQAAESAAAADVAQDKREYAQLDQERAKIDQRIAARIAAAKAEAARKAAAERARQLAAAKAAKAAAARKAAAERAARVAAAKARAAEKAQRTAEAKRERAKERAARSAASAAAADERKSSSSSSSRSSSSSSNTKSADHGFSFPVRASITSPYGMRFHPVLHYWKLHDGTDFGAGCGTAIRAPYSGKVVEKYYNAGYGNRLIVDHGEVDGRFVTTAYNHAIRYTVGVGDHVSKGEVIGYVGTTGYSTGCHLHLMVWLDGKMVNPMTWF